MKIAISLILIFLFTTSSFAAEYLKNDAQFYPTIMSFSSMGIFKSLPITIMIPAIFYITFSIATKIFLGDLAMIESVRLKEYLQFFILDIMVVYWVTNPSDSSPYLMFIYFCLLLNSCSFASLLFNRLDFIKTSDDYRLLAHAGYFFLSLFQFITNSTLSATFLWIYKDDYDASFLLFLAYKFTSFGISNSILLIQFIITKVYHRYYCTHGKTWPAFPLWILSAQIFGDVAQICCGAVFFFLLLPHSVIPIDLVRNTYMLISRLVLRIQQFSGLYPQIANFDKQFPELSPQEFEEIEDKTCAICRYPADQATQLQCGHVFCRPCLRDWIASSATCPTCRLPLDGSVKPSDSRLLANRIKKRESATTSEKKAKSLATILDSDSITGGSTSTSPPTADSSPLDKHSASDIPAAHTFSVDDLLWLRYMYEKRTKTD